MIVDAWYVPNTPTLVVEPAWKRSGFEARPQTQSTLARAGWITRANGADTIIVVSPHFEARQLLPVVTSDQPTQIHDFDGFPREFYEVQYVPPGDRALAERILVASKAMGLPVTAVEDEWGLDHGAWAPLSRMFPDANLPTVPVGIGHGVSDEDHERFGRALAEASAEKRVAIVATGSILHRLDLWGGARTGPDTTLKGALERAEDILAAGDWERLWGLDPIDVRQLQTEGGFRPLRVLAGAVGSHIRVEILSRETEYGAASLTVAHITKMTPSV